MPAGPMILTPPPHERTDNPEPILVSVAQRNNESRPRAQLMPTDAATRAFLLDYVDFVLDQEARYCQQ